MRFPDEVNTNSSGVLSTAAEKVKFLS
jgi:hypothetical protein